MNRKVDSKRTGEPEILPEYDFSEGVRGKYAKKFARHNNLVIIERDLARHFGDSRSVNEALRTLLNIRKAPRKQV